MGAEVMSDDEVLNKKSNNTSQGISQGDKSNEISREEQVNTIINQLNDLINDFRNSREISQGISQSQSLTSSQGIPTDEQAPQSQVPSTTGVISSIDPVIADTAQTLAALNSIKTELCRLPLDFCEKEYIANCITPLETVMEFIARTGFELSTSVSILTTSPIVPRKKGKLKDTIHTIYSMNDQVEDIYKVLKRRLKNIVKEDNCCIFP